jgi:hypothetical protein
VRRIRWSAWKGCYVGVEGAKNLLDTASGIIQAGSKFHPLGRNSSTQISYARNSPILSLGLQGALLVIHIRIDRYLNTKGLTATTNPGTSLRQTP